jgi:hypothetical protein
MSFANAARFDRPIPGAVATAGVSDRVAFLRKTYGLLGLSLIAFAVITGGMMTYMTDTSIAISRVVFSSGFTFFLVFAAFVAAGVVAQKLAMSESSRGLQLVGLLLYVVVQSLLLQPIMWFVMYKFGDRSIMAAGGVGMSPQALSIIMESVIITVAIFVGLTLTVFITKKDFSFLRGILAVSMFAVIGISLAAALFNFSLGLVFIGFVIVILGGYILYQTSLIMSRFPPQAYVAAALMLFATVATLFRMVLQVVASTSNRR